MGTVRRKLLLVVVACLVPSVLAALYRAKEAYDDLLDQAKARVDVVDQAFVSDLEQDLAATRLALRVAVADPRVASALETEDPRVARALTDAIAERLDGAFVVLADAQAHVRATSSSLAQEAGPALPRAELDGLLSGDGSVRLPWGGGQRLGIAVVEPVVQPSTGQGGAGKKVGLLAWVRPLEAIFVDHAREHGGEWTVRVNGQVVVQTDEHHSPAAGAGEEKAVSFSRNAGHLHAVNSFRPQALQKPGLDVVVTVAHDVSGVEAEVLRDLLRSLGILGAVLGGALALAVWMAQKMVRAIAAISRAAEALSRGQYVLAEGVRTKDELEHLATAFNQAVRGLQERDQLKENFGKYVTRQVAEQILQGKPRLGGEMVPVTVFFADIRGFTSISEKMEPKALLDFLNLYFSEMVEVVLAQGGVVDKFIGDAIMAVFGAPVPHPDDALRAVRAALEMNRRLKGLNQRFVDQGLPEIRVGIGMHSGTVVAGNMGHAERMEYTVIGDPVNLASRLEGMTKELGVEILVSEDTYLKVRDCVHAEPLHPIRVRGRQQEVMVYRLTEIKGSVTQAA